MLIKEDYTQYLKENDLICKNCRDADGYLTVENVTKFLKKKSPDELLGISQNCLCVLSELQEVLDHKHSRVEDIVVFPKEGEEEPDNEPVEYGYYMDEGSFMGKIFFYKEMVKHVKANIKDDSVEHKDFLSFLALTHLWLYDHKDCFIIDTDDEEVIVQPCEKLEPFDYFPCPKMAPYYVVES